MLIVFAVAIKAHNATLKGFLFGCGLNYSFAADQVTSEFLGYTEKSRWTPGFVVVPQCKLGFIEAKSIVKKCF
jgi:hypothetical protein